MVSGINNKRIKILFISSIDPINGPGRLGLDYYKAFKEQNYEIDFLTKYPVRGYEEIISVYDYNITKNKCISLMKRIISKCKRLFGLNKYPLPGYYFFYKKDTSPPVNISKVLKSIHKDYNLVIILFWQELLSAQTVESIYDKLNCPIFFRAVDYSPMTGGCHFFHACRKYMNECGSCPAWKSSDDRDFTNRNLLYRLYLYDKINPIIFCNKYVSSIMKNSRLFFNRRVENAFPVINENDFYPMNKQNIRFEYSISDIKKFIMFFGCYSLEDERKGMKYLFEALKIFASRLNSERRKEIQLIVAGKNSSDSFRNMPFDIIEVGYVNLDILPQLYSVADVYLSPSVVDAGPMMVNQSLSCGTPVVAFEMGTALEVVKNQNTGYCACMKDSVDFANGIEYIYYLDEENRKNMSKRCREIALRTTSYKSAVEQIMTVYNDIAI